MTFDYIVKLDSTAAAALVHAAGMGDVGEQRRQFGARLRAAREAARQDAQAIAKHFDLSVKTVYAWEAGGGLPDALRLKALCRLYQVSADRLLWGDEPDSPIRDPLTAEVTAALRKLDADSLRRAENAVRAFLELPSLPRPPAEPVVLTSSRGDRYRDFPKPPETASPTGAPAPAATSPSKKSRVRT